MLMIRFAEQNEYPAVLVHYHSCGYNGGLADDDKVVIAVAGEIIGAVRIATENDVIILRGMQIAAGWQRKGVGSLMLTYLAEHLDLAGCYCLPYGHLVKFYGMAGFEEIEAVEAPSFLAERLEHYLHRGLKTIIMQKKN